METPTLPTNWLAPLSNANHVRKQKIGQNSLTSLRPAPSASEFRSCRGLFRTFFLILHKKIVIRGLVNRFSCVLRVYDRSK